jgi:hypothetical protein
LDSLADLREQLILHRCLQARQIFQNEKETLSRHALLLINLIEYPVKLPDNKLYRKLDQLVPQLLKIEVLVKHFQGIFHRDRMERLQIVVGLIILFIDVLLELLCILYYQHIEVGLQVESRYQMIQIGMICKLLRVDFTEQLFEIFRQEEVLMEEVLVTRGVEES